MTDVDFKELADRARTALLQHAQKKRVRSETQYQGAHAFVESPKKLTPGKTGTDDER